MLIFHNFLFLTLQLISIEHKHAVTTQSSAHKVNHTHHSNSKHTERLGDMGFKGSSLASLFSYQVFDISNNTNYKFVKTYKFFCICKTHIMTPLTKHH